jgi:hypothetical protein
MEEIKRARGRPRKSEAEKAAAAEAKARAKAEKLAAIQAEKDAKAAALALEIPALASPRPGRELVACPFCGSEKCEIRERGREQFLPRCFQCDARLGLFSSKAEARNAWNTRVGGMIPVPVPEPVAPETDAPASEAPEPFPLAEALATMVVLSDLFSDPPPDPVPHTIDLSNRNTVIERAPGVFEVLLPESEPPPTLFDVGF